MASGGLTGRDADPVMGGEVLTSALPGLILSNDTNDADMGPGAEFGSGGRGELPTNVEEEDGIIPAESG